MCGGCFLQKSFLSDLKYDTLALRGEVYEFQYKNTV